ncbi:protein kinase domain-containing protein [Nonomuraea jiangxiensis]|uniref:non-specific serine/threonine protein kinase n=1 Tax=Nonomuraea jiangxiensis TaxID=633440 RepID=A0A1G8TAZ2_9ACTN|nr:caspase family protein [Nonomuraea jiangxiensis]SDJ38661.1 Serine/threonine protein kinase [Nonomuraea jiangxiensis]
MTRKIALVAGVGSYKGRWEQLDSCAHDADQVAAVLSEPEYDFDVTTIVDQQVTRQAILRWLVDAKTSGADLILFYFAGHGAVNDLGTFLVTFDNEEFDEGISLATLMQLLQPAPGSSTSTVVILDCCHSGEAASTPVAGRSTRRVANTDINNVLRQSDPSAVVIAACASDQRAWETTNLGHGIFTFHLLEALLGYAADHTGDVTVHSLYEVVSREMASLDTWYQDPVFGGRVTGRVILGSRLTPVLSPPRPEQEYERIELEAQVHLEEYNRLRSANIDTWRASGYADACRRLESISDWFARKEQIQGLSQREGFRSAKNTLIRYQTELGLVEPGIRTPWGVLEKEIGGGGFGKVWLIADGKDRRQAYKLYHVNELSDREKVKRFKNGYDAMRMLNHDRIVKVHDYSSCPPGFVMDYIEGDNLRDLAPGTFMDPVSILYILQASADAIADAHKHLVIHRDIKPENIICSLREDGVYEPFLTDFDLAWFSTQTQKATKTAMGVVYYAAPEQYVAFNPKAARSRTPALDVYSFGQLLYFCFMNADPEPLNIGTNVEKLHRRLLSSCTAKATRLIVDLYKGCVQFAPEDRVSDFKSILAYLNEVMQELTYTDNDKKLEPDEYVNEVAFQITGRVPEEHFSSFFNATGNWEITPEWRDAPRLRAGVGQLLSLHFLPSTRMAMENMSNERMRLILNRRVDASLAPFRDQATRHPGRQGAFTFFLEWRPKNMSRTDALRLCEAIRSVIDTLQAS